MESACGSNSINGDNRASTSEEGEQRAPASSVDRETNLCLPKCPNDDAAKAILTPVQMVLLEIDALLKEKNDASIALLISQMDSELLAELIMYVMDALPSEPPRLL